MPHFKYAKLRGRIKEKFGTQGRFAEAVGLSPITISRKLTGKMAFSSDDIERWCGLLEIPLKEAGVYFFA